VNARVNPAPGGDRRPQGLPSGVMQAAEIGQREAPRVRLEPSTVKIVEAIAFLVHTAEERQRRLTQYDILKSLFLADKEHLNTYGRPVTYDNYYAMKNGPVPSMAYNILKEDKRGLLALNKAGIRKLPWKKTKDPEPGSLRFYFYGATKAHEEEVLSPSDIDCLSNSLVMVKSLTYPQLRRLLHDDPAYVEAWAGDDKTSIHMSYGMLFDSPDFESAEQVAYLSRAK